MAHTLDDTRHALIAAVNRWAGSIGAEKADVAVADPPRPEWDVRVTPVNPRSASVLMRVDRPGRMIVHVGAGSWWEDIPCTDQVVVQICDAVGHGGFVERLKRVGDLVVRSRGELVIGQTRWTCDGGIPLLGLLPIAVREMRYEPY